MGSQRVGHDCATLTFILTGARLYFIIVFDLCFPDDQMMLSNFLCICWLSVGKIPTQTLFSFFN